MFEYNGKEYSLDQIQSEANAQGVDFNEYLDFLKTQGLVEKTQDSQITSAPAESETAALDTVSPSEDTFLVSPQDEEEADFLDKLGNIFENQIPTVKNAWESTKANLVDYVKFMGGKDAADFFVGESDGGIAFKDESTGETITFKNNPEVWKQIANDPNRDSYSNIKTIYKDTGKEVGEATDEFLIDTFKQIEKNKLEYKDTGKGIVGGFKEGNIGDVVLGAVNGLTSVVTTAGPAMMTGGLTLIPQVVAPMYTEYNMEKAKAKYGEDDPNAFEKLVENNETELGAPAVLGAMAYALEKIGIKGIGKYIASKSFAGKQAVKLALTGNKEGLTEYFQGGVEQINKGLAQGQDYEKVIEDTWDWMQSEEALENYAQGFVGSTGMSSSGRAISNAMKSSEQAKQDIYRQINVISSLNQAIRETNSNELKESYQEDLAIAEQNLREIVEENNRKAELLSKEQKDNVISNINQRKALRDKANKLIKQKDQGVITQQEFDAAAELINKQNKQIDDNIEVIRKSASDKLVQENINNVKKAAKNTYGDDVQIKELSAEEVKQYVRDNFKNLDKDQQESLTEEAAASQGFFEGAVIDGKQDVIINKDVTQETSGINVASHEFLHKVLSKSLDDKSRIEVGSALINQLAKMDLPQLEGSKFAKRLQLYKDKPESVQAEEILTLLSDAIRSGDLDFKEGVFARLGNTIRRGLQNAGIRKIKFDSGRDIYNFIKDYNKSIEKGILKGAVKEAAVEGITGKLIEQPVVNIKDDVAKFSKEIASQEVQNIYEQQGEAGMFDIFQKFKPITTRIARRFREVPGYDEQLIIDEIETGERGILDLIRSYKPESGVPLAAYINKFLPARSIEAGNRILKTEFESDVTEEKGVAATETAEDVVETTTREEGRKTKAKVIADELNIADKVASEVAEANIDPNVLTNFKSVPNAAINTVGEMLGISPAKIKSKANLTAEEVASAQRWFNKNAQLVIDALPQGFDVEGQATGVPKTVLAALYTQKESRAKTKAGLKGQVKRTNIKNSELLELVDIIDGKPTRNRNTSARVIALADLLGKTITNQEIRRTTPGTERIRSGMSKVMFSFAEDIINIKSLFELETKGIDKLLEAYDLNLTFDLKTEKGIEQAVETIKTKLLPLLPRDFWFGTPNKKGEFGTVFTPSYYVVGTSKNAEVKQKYKNLYKKFETEIKKLRDDKDVTFGEDILDSNGKPIDFSVSSYSTIFKDANTIKKNKKKIEAWNKKVALIHREMWKRFNKAIQDDKNNASIIGNYLKMVGSDTGHWHKLGAQFVGYSDKITGKRFEYEHAMPATSAYLYLMDAALSESNFDASYDLVIDNYKLIALDKAMDKKLTAVGLQRRMPEGWDLIENNWWDRYFNELVGNVDGGINPNSIVGLDGKGLGETLNVNTEGNVMFSKPIGKNINVSEAMLNARPALQYSKESRGMSTFDFDETLIIDGENFVTATKGDDVVKIPSDKWPIDGPAYADQGYEFDFSDFVNVRGGKEGPLLQKMKNQIKKYGPENVYVLTARMQEAATPIYEWLKSQGINIPIENITGLGNSKGEAKALWMLDKFAEGYNDMYFVDDALPNVEAVKDVLDQLDIKSKVVQAKIQFSKGLSSEFNKILEDTKGISAQEKISKAAAKAYGRDIGRYEFFIPPSADDFAGLIYRFLGKGKQGEAHKEFFKKALFDPFARADREMDLAKTNIREDYKNLKKNFPEVVRKLNKKITGKPYTYDTAIRVYLFDKAGYKLSDMSDKEIAELRDFVKADDFLRTFADTLGLITKVKEGYIKPGESWLGGNINSDLQDAVDKVGRKKFLAEWMENKKAIFSEANLNKIEATYGSAFRSALEDILFRMENGINRPSGSNAIVNRWNNWVNNSVGAIMFLNMRSAVLQTLSTVNFINFEDNNIFNAAKAFANQKQYWEDFSTLFNSPFLKQRRSGLQTDINQAELASAVAGAKNKARAAFQFMIKVGFAPTQIADSFAIATGGATFYRNRIKKYLNEGLDQKQAETKAFQDFQEISEETQQSARPDRISQQQASVLGRLVLAFQNTPMQYARLIKKASLDLVNKRGDWRSNVSKIIYYGAIQNIIFSAMQNAVFAIMFDDEEDKEMLDEKTLRIGNSMLDSILRGSGLAGGVVSTIKNIIIKFLDEEEKGYKADMGNVVVEAANISPPIGSKLRKLYSGLKTWKFKKDQIKETSPYDINNPAWLASGNVISAATNVPVDRFVKKLSNIQQAFNQDNATWQRIAVGLGWDQWGLGITPQAKEKDKRSMDVREVREKRSKDIKKAREERRKRLQRLK